MSNPKLALITLTHPRSPAAEAYRALRANLAMFGLEHPLHALVVTSAAPGEDKSTALANLAVVMVQGGQRVILVDADLRHPSLHELFGVPNERGLTTVLDEQDALTAPPLSAMADVAGLQLLTRAQRRLTRRHSLAPGGWKTSSRHCKNAPTWFYLTLRLFWPPPTR